MAQIIGREARYNAYLAMLKENFTPYAEVEVLNPDGSVDYVIGNEFIQEGSVNVNFQNGTRRTAQITLENTYKRRSISPDSVWFGQQYRVKAGLYLPDGTPYTLPQGVFYIKDPERQLSPNANTLSLNLTDKWAYLDGTLFGNLEGNFVAEINTDIYEIVSAVLSLDRGNGYPIDNISPLLSSYFRNKTVQLPDGSIIPVTNVPYTMRVEPQDKTLADILLELNDMLAGIIGYDNTGRLRIEPSNYDIQDFEKANLWEFKPTEKEFLGGTYSVKMSQVYNVVQVVGAVLNGMQAQAEVANYDATSPTSVQSALGRRIKRLTSDVYYSDEQCAALGLWHLKRLNVLQQSVSFTCSPMYHLQENMLVSVLDPQKNGQLAPHLVNGFTLPLGLGQMQVNATSINDDDNSIFSKRIIVTRVLESEDTQLWHNITTTLHRANAIALGKGQIDTTVDEDGMLVSLPSRPLQGIINNSVDHDVTLSTKPIAPLLGEIAADVNSEALLIPRASMPMRADSQVQHTLYGELWGRLTAILEVAIQSYIVRYTRAEALADPSAVVAATEENEHTSDVTLVARPTSSLSSILNEIAENVGATLIQRLPVGLQGAVEAGVATTVSLEAIQNIILLEGEADQEVTTMGNLVQLLAVYLSSIENHGIHGTDGTLVDLTPVSLQAELDGEFAPSATMRTLPPNPLSAIMSSISTVALARITQIIPTYMAGGTGGEFDVYIASLETANETPLEAEVGGISGSVADIIVKALSGLAAETSSEHGYTAGMVDTFAVSLSASMTSAISIVQASMGVDTPISLKAKMDGTFSISKALLGYSTPTPMFAHTGGNFGVEEAVISEAPQGELEAQQDFYHSAVANMALVDALHLIALAEAEGDSDPNLGVSPLDKVLATANGEGGESASLGVITIKNLSALLHAISEQEANMSLITVLSLNAKADGQSGNTATLNTVGLVALSATSSGVFSNDSDLTIVGQAPDWNVYINLGTVSSIHKTIKAPLSQMSSEIHYTFTTASRLNEPFFDIVLPEGYVLVENDFNDIVEADCYYSATLYNTGQRDSNGDIIIGLSVINWTLSTSRKYRPQGATMDSTSGATTNLDTIDAVHAEALATGTFDADATLAIITLIHWNKYYNKGVVAGISAQLIEPPADLTGEIHLTFTTDDTVQTNFYSLTAPSGYSIVVNENSDAIEPNGVYEATVYNTGQVDTDGNTIIGISTIKWEK